MSSLPTCVRSLVGALGHKQSCLFVSFPGIDNHNDVIQSVKEHLASRGYRLLDGPYGTPGHGDIMICTDSQLLENLSRIERLVDPGQKAALCLAADSWSLLRQLVEKDKVSTICNIFEGLICQIPEEQDPDYLRCVERLAPDIKRKILYLSGGHPRLAKRIKQLWRMGGIDGLEARATHDMQVKQILARILDYPDPDERGVLNKVARQRPLTSDESEIAEWLCKLGLLRKEGKETSSYRIFAGVLRSYICDLVSSPTLQFLLSAQALLSQYGTYLVIITIGLISGMILWLRGFGEFGQGAVLLVLVFLVLSLKRTPRIVRVLSSLVTQSIALKSVQILVDSLLEKVDELEESLSESKELLILCLIIIGFLGLETMLQARTYFEPWRSTATVSASEVFSEAAFAKDTFAIDFPKAIAAGEEDTITLHPSHIATIHYLVSCEETHHIPSHEDPCNGELARGPTSAKACEITFKTELLAADYPLRLPVKIIVWQEDAPSDKKTVEPPAEVKIHDRLPRTIIPVSLHKEIEQWGFWLVLLAELVLILWLTSLLHRSSFCSQVVHRLFGGERSRTYLQKGTSLRSNAKWREVWKDKVDSCVGTNRQHG